MAKSSNRRRGISLNPSPDKIPTVEQLTQQADASTPQDEQQAPDDADSPPLEDLSGLLVQIRHMNAELGRGLEEQWNRQERQLVQLEQQRDQIAEQAEQLRSLRKQRNATARVGVWLSVLSLSAICALAYHAWPKLQDMDYRLERAVSELERPNPELLVARGKMDALAQEANRMDHALTSLREQVLSMNSELGKLRKAVETPPKKNTSQVPVARPANRHYATTPYRSVRYSTNAYRNRHPMQPW